jgi:hypothetical protein
VQAIDAPKATLNNSSLTSHYYLLSSLFPAVGRQLLNSPLVMKTSGSRRCDEIATRAASALRGRRGVLNPADSRLQDWLHGDLFLNAVYHLRECECHSLGLLSAAH